MPYLVDTVNRPDPELRETLRPAHLAYLDEHLDLLIAAGAKLDEAGPGTWGSFYILEVEDRAAAEAFIAGEPYFRGGLLASISYSRWRKGFFDHRRLVADATPREGVR